MVGVSEEQAAQEARDDKIAARYGEVQSVIERGYDKLDESGNSAIASRLQEIIVRNEDIRDRHFGHLDFNEQVNALSFDHLRDTKHANEIQKHLTWRPKPDKP